MMVLALRTNRPWRLAWTGYLVAWAWWLVMSRWLIGVTGGGYAALAGYMAIYIPLTLLTVRWLHRRYRSAMVLTLPIVWVSYEFIRCNYPQGGFAWFALGHALAPSSPGQGVSRLIQIADLFGQHGVSFLVAMTNGLIVDLLTRPLMRRDSSRSRPRRTITAAVVLWAAAMVGAWTYGYFRAMPSATPPSGLLRVTVIQTNVPQNNKDHPTPDQMDADWRRMIKLTIEAGRAEPKTRLYVWPETMVPAALNREALKRDEIAENFHEQIGAISQNGSGLTFLIGAETASQWSTHTINGGTYELPNLRWNSAYLYRPDGTQASEHYDKIRRVPFGEYLPWIDDVPALKGLFQKYLSPYGDYDYTIQAGTQYTLFDMRVLQRACRRSPALLQVYDAREYGGRRGGVCPARFVSYRDADLFRGRDPVGGPPDGLVYDDQGEKRADMLINVTNDVAGTPRRTKRSSNFRSRCCGVWKTAFRWLVASTPASAGSSIPMGSLGRWSRSTARARRSRAGPRR